MKVRPNAVMLTRLVCTTLVLVSLAVGHAARFVLVVNLKTARKLGVRVPPSVLVAARKIIE